MDARHNLSHSGSGDRIIHSSRASRSGRVPIPGRGYGRGGFLADPTTTMVIQAVPSISPSNPAAPVAGGAPSDRVPLSESTSATVEVKPIVDRASPSLPAELPAEGTPAYALLQLLKELGIASKFDVLVAASGGVATIAAVQALGESGFTAAGVPRVRARKLVDHFEKITLHSNEGSSGGYRRRNSLPGPNIANGTESCHEIASPEGQANELLSRLHTATVGRESIQQLTERVQHGPSQNYRATIAPVAARRRASSVEVLKHATSHSLSDGLDANAGAAADSLVGRAARRRASSVEVSTNAMNFSSPSGPEATASAAPGSLSGKASSAPSIVPSPLQPLQLPSSLSPQPAPLPRAGRANGVADEGSSPSRRVRSEVTVDEIGRRRSNTAPAAAAWSNTISRQELPNGVTEVSLPTDTKTLSAENLCGKKTVLRSSPAPTTTGSRLQLLRRLSVLTSSQDVISNDVAPATFSPMSGDSASEFFQLDDNSVEDDKTAAGSRSSTVSSHSSRMDINTAKRRSASTGGTHGIPNESNISASASPPLSPLTPTSPLPSSSSNVVGSRRRQSIVGQQLLQRALSGGSIDEALGNDSPRNSPSLRNLGVSNSEEHYSAATTVRSANSRSRRHSIDIITETLNRGNDIVRGRSTSTSSSGNDFGISTSLGSDSSAARTGKLLLKAQIASPKISGLEGSLDSSNLGPRSHDSKNVRLDSQGATLSTAEKEPVVSALFVKRKQSSAPLMASLFGTFGDNSDDEPSMASVLGENQPQQEGKRALGQPAHNADDATVSSPVSPLLSESDLLRASADTLPFPTTRDFSLTSSAAATSTGEFKDTSREQLLRQTSPPSPAKTPRAGRLVPVPEPLEPVPDFTLNGHDGSDQEEGDDKVDKASRDDQSEVYSPIGLLRASAVSPVSAPAALRTYIFPGSPQEQPHDENVESSTTAEDRCDGSDGVRMLGAARFFPKVTSTSFKEHSLAYDASSPVAPNSTTSASFDTGAGVGGTGTAKRGSVASWLEGRTVPGQGALDPASVLVLEVLRVHGLEALKVGRSGSAHATSLRLSADGEYLHWRSLRKGAKSSRVRLATVTRIQFNQVSKNFARYNNAGLFGLLMGRGTHTREEALALRSLSLAWDGGVRTLDLVLMPSPLLKKKLRPHGRRNSIGAELADDETSLVVAALRIEARHRAAAMRQEPAQRRFLRELFSEADYMYFDSWYSSSGRHRALSGDFISSAEAAARRSRGSRDSSDSSSPRTGPYSPTFRSASSSSVDRSFSEKAGGSILEALAAKRAKEDKTPIPAARKPNEDDELPIRGLTKASPLSRSFKYIEGGLSRKSSDEGPSHLHGQRVVTRVQAARLLGRLHAGTPKHLLERVAQEAGDSKTGLLTLDDFEAAATRLDGHHDVRSLWAALCVRALGPSEAFPDQAEGHHNTLVEDQNSAKQQRKHATAAAEDEESMTTVSDTLRSFLLVFGKEAAADYLTRSVKAKHFSYFLLHVQRESPKVAADIFQRLNLIPPENSVIANHYKEVPQPTLLPEPLDSGSTLLAPIQETTEIRPHQDSNAIDERVAAGLSEEISRGGFEGVRDSSMKPLDQDSPNLNDTKITVGGTQKNWRAGIDEDISVGSLGSPKMRPRHDSWGGTVDFESCSGDEDCSRNAALSDTKGNQPSLPGDDDANLEHMYGEAGATSATADTSTRHSQRKKNHRSVLQFADFVALTMGPENSLTSPQCAREVYHDMSQPLSHYWIASSHNTYLTGDQLASASSVDRYIEDLLDGCRCVEIDMWDSVDGSGEPCVYHGGTLTSKIKFRDVIQAVADYAFEASPYPVILSFENHCSPPFQRRMAFHIKDILVRRNMLWLPPESKLSEGSATLGELGRSLPSPEEARGKVLIKAKTARFAKKSKVQGGGFMSPAMARELSAAAATKAAPKKRNSHHASDIEATDAHDFTATEASVEGPQPPRQRTVSQAELLVGKKQLRRGSASNADGSGFGGAAALVRVSREASISQGEVPKQEDDDDNNIASPVSYSGRSSASAAMAADAAAATAAHVSSKTPSKWSIFGSKRASSHSSPAASATLKTDQAAGPTSPGSPGAEGTAAGVQEEGPGESKKWRMGLDTEERQVAVVDELDELVAIKGRRLNNALLDIEASRTSTEVETCHSLKESRFEALRSKGSDRVLHYTQTKLLRTYPDNLRIDSSNYDPVVCWNQGVQMVALNYQTSDLPMHLYRGRFRDNGGCGYLLRPPFLNPPNTVAMPSLPTTEASIPMMCDNTAISEHVPDLGHASAESYLTKTINAREDSSSDRSSSRDTAGKFSSLMKDASTDPSKSNDPSTGSEWVSVTSQQLPLPERPPYDSPSSGNVAAVSDLGSSVAKGGSASAQEYKEQHNQQKDVVQSSQPHTLSSRFGLGMFTRRPSAPQSRGSSSSRGSGESSSSASSSGPARSRLNQRLNRRHRSLSPFHSPSNKPSPILIDDVEDSKNNDNEYGDDVGLNTGSRGRSSSGDEMISPNMHETKLKRPKSFSPTVSRTQRRPFGSFIGRPSKSPSPSSSRGSLSMSRASGFFRRNSGSNASPKHHSHSPNSKTHHDATLFHPELASGSPSASNSRRSSRRSSGGKRQMGAPGTVPEDAPQSAARAAVASPTYASFYSHYHGRGGSDSGSNWSKAASKESSLDRSWEPPRSFQLYAGDPIWGSHAAVRLHVRVLSAAHVPKHPGSAAAAHSSFVDHSHMNSTSSNTGAHEARTPSHTGIIGRAKYLLGGIMGGSPASNKPTSSSQHHSSHDKASLTKGPSTSRNSKLGEGSGSVPKISEAKEPEGEFGRASLQVDLVGAPCDHRRWACDEVKGSAGSKFIFDCAFKCQVAEPRLALLKFAVLRSGVQVAQTAVPVHLMRPGLRWVQLYDPDARTGLLTERFVLTRLLVLVGAQVIEHKSDNEVRTQSDLNGGLTSPGEQFFPLKAHPTERKPALAALRTVASMGAVLPKQTHSSGDEHSNHRANSDPPTLRSSDPSKSSSFAEAISAHQECYVNEHSCPEFREYTDGSDSADSSDSSDTSSERSVNTIDLEDAKSEGDSSRGDGDRDSDDISLIGNATGSA